MSKLQIPILHIKRLMNALNFTTKQKTYDILPHIQCSSGINPGLTGPYLASLSCQPQWYSLLPE